MCIYIYISLDAMFVLTLSSHVFCEVTAQFLAEEGAKCIALLSRGGRAPSEATATI